MKRTCRRLSEETKLKISMAMKGRIKTEKHEASKHIGRLFPKKIMIYQ